MLKLFFVGAPWCSQCPQAKVNFERAINKFQGIEWEYIDTETSPDLRYMLDVVSVPAVVALRDRTVVARMGTGTTLQYRKFIEGLIN
nr:MAG TPA: TRX family protein [Caudoviricetes sp.]